MLYYLYYVEGAVTPLMLPYYHMSFQYFLYLLVVSNAIGAFTAFIGGLSDKIGRANLTIYGTLIVGLVQLLGVPHIHSKFGFAVAYCVIGFVEGIILVSTPALMRDFSPQMGRGAAMGFWALGPTMGSLAASLVATHTLTHLHPWQDQFIISGLVCMSVVVVSFFFLRELSPQLRDQLMVSERERALIEARAQGNRRGEGDRSPASLDVAARPDLVVGGGVAASALLLRFGQRAHAVLGGRRSAARPPMPTASTSGTPPSSLGHWSSSESCRTDSACESLSCSSERWPPIVMTLFLIVQVGHPHTGYYSNVLVVVLLATAIGCAYAPWMANYTEQVEAHNPALSASGLAVWGWILRLVVAVSFIVLPRVITTSTTLVDNQGAATTLQAIQAAVPYAPSTTACAAKDAPATVIAGLQATAQPGTSDPGQGHHLVRPVTTTCSRPWHGRRWTLQPAGAGPPGVQPAGRGHRKGSTGE